MLFSDDVRYGARRLHGCGTAALGCDGYGGHGDPPLQAKFATATASHMIHLSLLFWLALVLPGFAILCHLDRTQLRSGLLGTLGLSYLATFGLLVPISILCYLLHLPIAVFGLACVLLVIAGGIEITRRRWWRRAGKLIAGALGVELLIVAIDLVWGARLGGLFMGDPYLHLARIRHLYDHGLTNDDPFVAGGHFFAIYHTNLLHALYAACAWVTRVDYLSVWHAALPFAKLLVASGCYYLAWCVFKRRWAAWVAALFFLGLSAPLPNLVFPNRIAPFFVCPILIGLAIQFSCRRCTWRYVLAFAVGLAVLEQIHGIYAVFAVGLLGPVLLVVAVFKLIRKRPDRRAQLACLLVLPLALVSPAITKLNTAKTPANIEKPAKPRFWHFTQTNRRFIDLDNGQTLLHPLRGFGAHGGIAHALLAAGAIGALCTRRRREAGFMLAVAITGAAALYVPPICSGFLAVIGQKWIIYRLEFILFLSLAALLPATVAYLLDNKLRFRPLRAILGIAAVFVAMPFCLGGDDHTWSHYLKKGKQPHAVRRWNLTELRSVREFFRQHIPPNETVLVEGLRGMQVVMLHDCHLIAPQRGSIGVPQMAQRRRDLDDLLSTTTSPARRRELLRKYKIRYYVPTEVSPWVRTRGKNAWTLEGRENVWVIELKP